MFLSQSEAFFLNTAQQQVTADGNAMSTENTGSHRNTGRLCLAALAGLLRKSFQFQKPINTLRQFIYISDTFHLSSGLGEKDMVFPCHLCL